jgi:LSD1 subclass zinc finger protein
MEENSTHGSAEKSPNPAPDDRPIIHRVCEACNNMFATRPGEKSLRCPNCTKEHKQ